MDGLSSHLGKIEYFCLILKFPHSLGAEAASRGRRGAFDFEDEEYASARAEAQLVR